MVKPLCMFCASEVDDFDLTMEHFVPKCLWEKRSRPEGTKTLPAHKSCNLSYSEDNEYFRDVLAMEEGASEHPEVQKLRSGAIGRKFANRFGSVRKTLRNVDMRHVKTASGLELGKRPTFEVDLARIERVLCNVMKGVFYVAQKQPLPPDFVSSVRDVRGVNPDWVKGVVCFMVPWQSFGDSVFCCRYAVSSRIPVEKMTCLLQFFEHRLFIGEAISPVLLGQGGELFVPERPGSPILVPRWAAERNQ